MRNDPEGCKVEVVPGDDGGITVDLHIPTYSGGATLSLSAQRSADGDWIVFIPWPDGLDDAYTINDGLCDAAGGIAYLGAPEVEEARDHE